MKHPGFTLAELLICIAILGLIAAFSIPKILQARVDGEYNSIAKEAMSTVSGAFQAYKTNHEVTANTGARDLTPFMNYVRLDSTSELDDTPGGSYFQCGVVGGLFGTLTCLRLHNGAVLEYGTNVEFGGVSNTNAIFFYLDPDGVYSGSTTGEGKSLVIFLYANGRVTTFGNVTAGTANNITSYNPNPANDPSWFRW